MLVIGSSSAVILALTWGGVFAPWDSARVLAPLVVGLVALVLFLVWEAKWAAHPLVCPSYDCYDAPRSNYFSSARLGPVLPYVKSHELLGVCFAPQDVDSGV